MALTIQNQEQMTAHRTLTTLTRTAATIPMAIPVILATPGSEEQSISTVEW